MLNNYVFYSLNDYKLQIEKRSNKENLKKIFDSGIKCYTSFFPTTKVVINTDNGKLVIYNKGRLYASKDPLNFCYCIVKKENGVSINYNIFNLFNEHLMEINLSIDEDFRFRFLFNQYFIFTDFKDKYEVIEYLSEGLYVDNYKVKIKNQGNLNSPIFYAKFYDKHFVQKK